MSYDPDMQPFVDALAALTERVAAMEQRTVPAQPASWLTVSQFRDRATETPGDHADALERLAAAASATKGRAWVRIDLEGAKWATSRPITLSGGPAIVQDGAITALPSDAWDGGSTDSTGTPCKKGVIRLLSDGHRLRNLFMDAAGVACGIEDGPVASRAGKKSRSHDINGCEVLNFERYGFRYASDDGGGFCLRNSKARKFRHGDPRLSDADLNTGYPLLLDAGDGEVYANTFFAGERQIMQLRKGTILLTNNHPWQPPSLYTRQVSGPAGVPILMPHQVRGLDEVTADPALVSVSRDEVWRLVVTPLADIPAEAPVTVRYRRDPVNIELRGYGSTWVGTYLDGGTVRIHGHTPQFAATMFLPGGMELPSGRVPAVFELVADYPGQVFDLSDLEAPAHKSLDARAIAYPNISKPKAWPGNDALAMAAF